MATTPIDYAALAKQSGAISSTPAALPAASAPGGVDYGALAKQAGAISSTPGTPAEQDIFQKAVNYRTGNNWIDAPMGVLQGAAKGAAGIGEDIGAATRWALGKPQATQEQKDLDTKANGIGQGTGKFLEQAAEYALPATEAAKLTKGAGLLVRAGAQSAVGAGVSAMQSGGDPTATAIGGVLGPLPELAGAATSGVKALLAEKAPTLANFAESFGKATPTQQARITKALPTLIKDGITPADSVHETQDMVNGKLSDLSKAYQDLDPAVKAREMAPDSIINDLRTAQQPYMQRGIVLDDAAHGAIEKQIGKVQAIADANGGKLNVDDIVKLKQNANGKTNFQSVQADQDLWRSIGDTYRSGADTLAPETTPLNQDWAKYSDLKQIVDENIARGKGNPSGLDKILARAAQHGTGAAAGAALGHAVAGPWGSAVGTVAGGIIGPKLGKATAQAIQNAIDSGAFQALGPVKQGMLKAAVKIGDNAAVLKMLGQAATQETLAGSR
jgi:hypothetical protein